MKELPEIFICFDYTYKNNQVFLKNITLNVSYN